MSDDPGVFSQYALDIQNHVPDSARKAVTELALELWSCTIDIDFKEKEIEQLKKRRDELANRIIPDSMDDIGQTSLGLNTCTIEVVPYFHASIKQDAPNREQALDYLDEKYPDTVKCTVSVAYGKSDYQEARLLQEHINNYLMLRNRGPSRCNAARDVHWSTLTALVKEQTLKGNILPLDLLNATVGRTVKITPKKRG